MTALPLGWVAAPIGNLCTLRNGRAFKPSDWVGAGVPIVRIQNLNNQRAKFNFFAGEVDERFRLRGGELLFAWSGTPGTSFGAHVWYGKDAVLNQHIFRVDFDEKVINKRFFRFAINQKLDELIGIAHGGAGLQHVTKGKFEGTVVFLPPLSEQTRIADKLDTVLARVDAARARLDRIPALLKRFRQSVLVAATSGDLTEDWRGGQRADWENADVQSVAQVGTGSTPLRANSKFYAKNGTPWITSAATSSRFVTSAEQFVTGQAIRANRLKIYPIGTLLVAMYGEGKTRGQVSELSIAATINQACAAVQVEENKADKRYVRIVLEGNYLEMRELAEGGNQPNLNLSKIKKFPLPLPPIDEQTEIVRRVESLFALADTVQAQYDTAKARFEKLTPALLAKAFRGELVPQDPSDEPAEKLLERLRASQPDTEKSATNGRKAKAGKR